MRVVPCKRSRQCPTLYQSERGRRVYPPDLAELFDERQKAVLTFVDESPHHVLLATLLESLGRDPLGADFSVLGKRPDSYNPTWYVTDPISVNALDCGRWPTTTRM